MKKLMFVFKFIVGIIFNGVLFAVLVFGPADTWDWWRAWVFVGVVYVGTVATMFSLLPGHKDLLRERFKPLIQKGQPLADKIVAPLFVMTYCGLVAFIPLDVFRYHLIGRPGAIVSSLGLALVVTGWCTTSLALRENSFAAPVIKHQKDRQQKVVDTGVYSVVRHPLYAGGVLLMIGMPLWLESYAAVFVAIVPVAMLAIRILIEESFLRRKLEGYVAYTQKVRYRLIPFLW